MVDFEIDIQETPEEEDSGIQLPLNFLTFGEIESDDVKIYIKQSTYKALEKLAASDTTKELGSILIGEYSQEMGKTHVVISDFIEAKYTDASASTLTFTHETWDYVHREHEKHYSQKKIIGWQHTHPSYGIFLSNYDMFIQENFFNLPFQIAYVIDPIQNLRGFFQWKNGRIEKLKGYYIYDDIGKPIKIEQVKRKTEEPTPPAKPSRAATVFISLLCILTVLLSIAVFSLYRQYRIQQENQASILSQLQQQSNTITQLKEQLDSSQTAADEMAGLLEDNRITMQNQEAVISQLQALLGTADTDSETYVCFVPHTVVRGETLFKICLKYGLDYPVNKEIILMINNIEDPALIYAGQVILIPVYS